MFDVCTTGDTAHIDTIFKFLPHTCVNMGASIFFTAAMIRAFWSSRSRVNVGTNTLHEMNVAQYPQNYSCDIPKHKTTSSPERPFSHYIHSHSLAAEMWTLMKNNLLGKIFLSCSFYLYSFSKYVSYGFPIKIVCNPGVHYETPCTTRWWKENRKDRSDWKTRTKT